MEFTGERFVPTLQGDIRLEHLQRYEWCLPFVAGKNVLDIACGEGYGSHILARSAAAVIGVDISAEAVQHAESKYAGAESLSFKLGDAAEIPLPDQSVDVVVSFETIEHHVRHHEMMSEIRRVLTPDGLLIISSPNKKIYSDLGGGDHNHFHVKELYFSELDQLLRQYFSGVSYFGQRVTAAALLQPLDTGATANTLRVSTETEGGVVALNPARIEPMYYLAVASNRELPDLPGASGFFSEIDNPFYEKQREVLGLEAEIRRMSAYIAEVEGVLKVRDTDLVACRSLLTETQSLLADTRNQLNDTRGQLDLILNSRSWKLVQKLRALLGRK